MMRLGALLILLVLLALIALATKLSPLAVVGIYPCLALASLIVAPGWAASAGREFCGAFFWPAGEVVIHAPLSAVDGNLVAERWDEADEILRDLCLRYPEDPQVWLRVLRLAWREPVDVERARAAHRSVLEGMTNPVERERLNRFYLAFAESRLADQEVLEAERVAFERRCAWWEAMNSAAEHRKSLGMRRGIKAGRAALRDIFADPRGRMRDRGH